MKRDGLEDTKPDLPVLPADAAVAPHFDVDVGGRTHAGLVRANNEDNFHIVRFGRYLDTVLSSLPAGKVPQEHSPPGYGFAVADGLGGHAAGEVASRIALTVLVECALQTPDWILGRDDELLARVMERTAQRFQQVDAAIRDQAQSKPGLRNMGTTLSLVLSLSDALVVAHAGDSRAYLFRGGVLQRLTRDHTMGEQMVGNYPAAASKFRHVLTRYIGGWEPSFEPDVAQYRLADGDRLLLCTDGLTNMVDDAAIAQELGREMSSDETCRALVKQALGGGGLDNITVVVATYRRSEPRDKPSRAATPP
jgi:serine/threonine protein phosphatase PrpC